ncbi:murein hydrolase effector protein LrgB [Dolosigranulum pigrum]|uniref:Murein hydrolase effector protein LrgB n=1 Tax=Dolosigranulum pigrum TaxID=29394 RepID=A0A1S8KPQ0_9LACT|nr:murein hydrolase effector protein LrgB [Dolosigranulum pigrum]
MISELFVSPFTGIFLTIFFFLIGRALYSRWQIPLFNPLIFAIICIILLLMVTNTSYEDYYQGGQYIGLWITPATVALAIKLKKNYHHLKQNYISILTGVVAGVLFHTVIVLVSVLLLRLNSELFATLYPKSITTAIALGVSESLGGIVSLTVAIVVFTGIVGAVVAEPILKLCGVTDPVAQGIAIGSSSHAMGTTKAIQMGQVQGAMSGLAIIVTGIIVVVLVPVAEIILASLF